MPPQTRSRISGITRKIKYEESMDLSDDSTSLKKSNAPKPRKTKRRKETDDESEFLGSSDDTISESASNSITGSGDEALSKPVVSSRRSSRSVRDRAPERSIVPSVSKLPLIDSHFLELGCSDHMSSIEKVLSVQVPLSNTVRYLRRKLSVWTSEAPAHFHASLESEVISVFMSLLTRTGSNTISEFFASSCAYAPFESAKQCFRQMEDACRQLLRSHEIDHEIDLVDPLVLEYEPKWIRNLEISAPRPFIEE